MDCPDPSRPAGPPSASADEAVPAVESMAPGLWRVPIPIGPPLGHVNAYLIRGHQGWTVVDTGYHTPAAEQAWLQAFRALGLKPADLERIVVTHYHPDHLGAAGWLQQLSGAPVFLLEQELPQVRHFWTPGSPAGEQTARFFIDHGMPPELAAQLAALHEQQVARVQPLPRIDPLPEGATVAVEPWQFQALWMPGHADGLMVLWEPQHGVLLASDLILEQITPHVSLWPHHRHNPLAWFLASLRRAEALPARLVLTGHRRPVASLQRRIQELLQHHRRRLDRVVAIVRGWPQAGEGPSGWQVKEGLFQGPLGLANTRFAMAETLAHLDYLVREGQLVAYRGADGVIRYRLAAGRGAPL